MLTRVAAGPFHVVGVSVGGVYTSLSVPELDVIFDVGIAPRSFVGQKHLLISHGHADHIGSLTSLLGVRGLSRSAPPRIFLPAEIADDVREAVARLQHVQRRGFELEFIAVAPEEEHALYGDLSARVFRTLHTVPSVGYSLFRRVQKLRAEFVGLAGGEIRSRRQAGEDLFEFVERTELAYATDTLVDVLDEQPSLLEARVLVLECTFLDDRKGRGESRDKCHIHLDEILERADTFQNEHLVLMHFSQLYQPAEVHEILKRRVPAHLQERLVVCAPQRGAWAG